MVNAQQWLDRNYPKSGTCLRKYNNGENHHDFGKTREEIEVLNISQENLEGDLDLSDFKNLGSLYCSDNYLTQIIYPANPKKLTKLDISNNNLNSDLTIFSQFRNLERLEIGNHDKIKIQQGIYNRFLGGLKPLEDLSELYSLDISNTDIDNGLEYLSESIKFFSCSAEIKKDAKVKTIESDWEYCGEDVKAYKKLIKDTLAQQWLDKNYPLNELCKWEKDKINYNKKKEKK